MLRPNIIQTLAPIHLRVNGRHETTARQSHDVKQKFGELACDGCKKFIATHMRLPRVQQKQLALVVQHLFKVRHGPRRIHRVAMKAAIKLVAHPAERHAIKRANQRELSHFPRRGLQKQRQRWLREFRRATKAAVDRVMKCQQRAHGVYFHLLIKRLAKRSQLQFLFNQAREFVGLRLYVSALVKPRVRHAQKQLRKTNSSMRWRGRKISARKKWTQRFRFQKYMQRPTAT